MEVWFRGASHKCSDPGALIVLAASESNLFIGSIELIDDYVCNAREDSVWS